MRIEDFKLSFSNFSSSTAVTFVRVLHYYLQFGGGSKVISPSSFCILFAEVLMDFAFFGGCFTFLSSSLFLELEPDPGPDSLIFCNYRFMNFTC